MNSGRTLAELQAYIQERKMLLLELEAKSIPWQDGYKAWRLGWLDNPYDMHTQAKSYEEWACGQLAAYEEKGA